MTLSRSKTAKPKSIKAKKRGRKKFITWSKTHYTDDGEMKGHVLKRGWLWKKGERFHAWRQRYFILTTHKIYYFKEKSHCEEYKWAGVIPLYRSAVTEAPEREKAHCFKVCTGERIFYLCADSDVEMQDWIARTHKAIDILKAEFPDDDYDEDEYTDGGGASSTMVSPRSMSHYHADGSGAGGAGGQQQQGNHQRYSIAQDDTDYSARYSDNETDEATTADAPTGSKVHRNPYLTEAEELDIAISATYIFSKPVEERTSEEQAYVIAMKDYGRKLEKHMEEYHCGPEFGLASGVAVFAMNEEEISEQMKPFIEEMKKEYIQEMKYQFEMENDKDYNEKLDEEEQIARAASAIFAKRPSERTNEEREYIQHLQQYAEELLKVEVKCGIAPQHGLASGTVNFVKEAQQRSVEDTEYVVEMMRLLQQQQSK